MPDHTHANVYNIQPGQPFARTLAQKLLNETRDDENRLGTYTLLLPTRRACRILQDTFLELRQQKALILPQIQPIGDLDEEELTLSILGHNASQELSLKPALSSIKRQILLARLIQKMHPDQSNEQALTLAQALGQLMDQIYT